MVTDILDLIAPMKVIILRSMDDSWFNAELVSMWKQIARLYNSQRRIKFPIPTLQDSVISLLPRKKAYYFKSLANDIGNSNRMFWSTMSPYLSSNKKYQNNSFNTLENSILSPLSKILERFLST